MINLLISTKDPAKIDFFEFDVTVHESHEYTNIVSEYPVEEGYNIADHALRMPEKLVLEGFVTNSPIPRSRGSLSVLADRSDRVNSALESLLQIGGFDAAGKMSADVTGVKRTPQVVTVTTGLRAYTNMVMTNVTITRDKSTGDALTFTVEMQRLIVAYSQSATIQNTSELNGRAPHTPKMAAKTIKSATTTTAATADQGSFLLKIMNKLKGI